MSQLPLFAQARETVLVDDTRGRIVYMPDFLPAQVARAWFDEVRGAVGWEAQRRRMYDREVDVPRLVGHFRLAPPDAPVPEVIRAAARRVIAVTGVAFTSVGLNFYRDGRDSVAPHNDHLDEIAPGCPIALLSLGATRRMTIRAKAAPRRVFHLDLAAGSLLLMSYDTQLHYTHGVPKTSEPVGPRISLAFRVRLAADEAGRPPTAKPLTGVPGPIARTPGRPMPDAPDEAHEGEEPPVRPDPPGSRAADASGGNSRGRLDVTPGSRLRRAARAG
jgi:alkylated DNA repair dioxygenase AlkB